MTSTVSHVRRPAAISSPSEVSDEELFARYRALSEAESLPWSTNYRKLRLLGTGGAGRSLPGKADRNRWL